MWSRLGQCLVIFTTIVFVGSVTARSEAPSQAEVRALLSAEQFSELDKRYSEIQSAYESGLISDEDLRAAFRVFYSTDPGLESKYALWVQQIPESYVAHLARGIYYLFVGFERRGNRSISETTAFQLEGMEDSFRSASEEFKTSSTLDKRPILTYLYSIDISKSSGNKEESRRLLDSANKIDPRNFIVKQMYMGSLQTRWGGSTSQMEAFLKECKEAGLTGAHIQNLDSLVLEDRAWVEKYQNSDMKAAARYYKKAGKLNPTGNCLVCAAETLRDSGKYAQAIKEYSKAIAADPSNAETVLNRGYTYLQMHLSKEAVADWKKAGGMGSATAQDYLGRAYLLGFMEAKDGTKVNLVKPDRDTAIEWLRKAADQGYAPAKQLLPIALNKDIQILPDPSK